jgi:alkylated DNA repair dioxygenase AlkB
VQEDLPDINTKLAGGGRLQLFPQFIEAVESKHLIRLLLADIEWRQDVLQLFGKQHKIPRLHQWFGDPDAEYRWSGLTLCPEPWSTELAELRDRVSEAADTGFNSVLVNCYRDGRDSMGWHADDEPELGQQPVIASLSLGVERDFMMRYRDRSAGIDSLKIPLSDGSLLIMSGNTQRDWQHALPRRKRVESVRLNLTFRQVKPQLRG